MVDSKRGWISLLLLLAAMFPSGAARAEVRTWNAAVGGYKVDAEFVAVVAGKTVRLLLSTGETRDVPLDQLSAADQEYVRRRTTPGTKSPRAVLVEREAERCRSARDALRVYKLFVDGNDASDADRAAFAPRIAELEPSAEKNLFRIGGKWVTEDEALAIHKQANDLMKLGFEALRLGQEETFRKKFAEAAALEPEEVRADFILAILYSFSNRNRNVVRASQYYDACLKRDPANTAVLNNLALLKMKNGDFRGAIDLWKQAMQIAPDQRVCHNIGKLVKLAGMDMVTIAKPLLEQLTDLYLSNIGDDKLQPTDASRGWLHLLIDGVSPDLDLDLDKSTEVADVRPPSTDAGVVTSGGTGFVVYPGYVVTNAHVVKGGSGFEIQTVDGTRETTLRAEVVATSKTHDLALLKCEKLTAAPVALDPTPCRRGTDIMVLGYPEMFTLGATLKATRGVISGLPSPALDNLYLYDASTNGGNSGGPVCDAHGNVVAVHCIGTRTSVRYGGGIPAADVVAFLKQSLPKYDSRPPSTQTLDWPAVDQQVSPATVLVWVRRKDVKQTTALVGALEDHSCLSCKAVGTIKCLNGGCINGFMNVRANGGTVRAKCPICDGSGVSKCPHCLGTGIDRDVLKAAVAAKVAAAAAAGTTPAPAAGDTEQGHQPLSQRVVDAINKQIADNGIYDKSFDGTRRLEFREAPKSTGFLIGLDLTTFDMTDGKKHISAVRPLFLTAQGKQLGNWHGTPAGTPIHVEARPGYLINQLHVGADSIVRCLKVSFGSYTDEGKLGSGYSSELFGTSTNGQKDVPTDSKRGFILALNGSTVGTSPDLLTGLGVTVPNLPLVVSKSSDDDLVNKPISASIRSDKEMVHPPLSAELADYISGAVTDKKTFEENDKGIRGDGIYRDVPADGAILIGFDISYGQGPGGGHIQSLRPIFLTRKGKTKGKIVGVGGAGATHIEAKPGYAVSRYHFQAESDGRIRSLTMTFMKIGPKGLDPNDSYEGSRYGFKGGSRSMVIYGTGKMIVGIFGVFMANGNIGSLGAVLVPAMPNAP